MRVGVIWVVIVIPQHGTKRIPQYSSRPCSGRLIAPAIDPYTDFFYVLIVARMLQVPTRQHGYCIFERNILNDNSSVLTGGESCVPQNQALSDGKIEKGGWM